MSTPRTRVRFMPNVLRGEGRAAANQVFSEQAARWSLVWTCRDCAYAHPSTGACTVGWPNEILLDATQAVVNESGFPAFCKAFEPE
jgi:hypothetical protein